MTNEATEPSLLSLRDTDQSNEEEPTVRTDSSMVKSSCQEELLPDSLKKQDDFGCWHWIVTLGAIFAYLYDVGTDLNLAVMYGQRARTGDDPNYYWYFGLTLGFLIVPAYLIGMMSLWEAKSAKKTPFSLKFIKGICVFLLLSPVAKRITILYYGYKKNYQLVKEEKKRIAFFGLFESFFESAPQILLQFYLIMIKIDKDDDSIRTSQIASLVGSFVSLARALNNFNNMYFINKTLSSITTSQNQTEVFAENNGDNKTADTSSCCDKLTCTVITKMYQSIIDFLQNPKSTAENVIRKFKMDKVIFFVAHFLGIASRAIAISAFASFSFNHSNSSNMGWEWYTSAIVIHSFGICVWLYFFNTVNPAKDDITRWQLWKQRLRIYFILVWIHFFTFFPPSDSHMLGASSGIAEKVKKRGNDNLSTRDYRGVRFCLFFFIYYIVMLTENGLFVGFWWASLPSNSSSTTNKLLDGSFNTTLAEVSLVPSSSFPFERYVVLCLNICFSLFSPFLLVIYYSIRSSKYDEKETQQEIQNDNALVDITDSPETDHQEEIKKEGEQSSRSSIIRKCGSRSISHLEPDLSSTVPVFSWLHACVIIAQGLVFVFKVVIDIALVILFYFRAVKGEDPHYWYFGLLIGILIVPAFITSVMSFMKFKQDHGGPDKACKLPFCICLLSIGCILLLLSYLGRCINRLYYGIKSKMFLKEEDWLSAKVSYEHMETETRQHALIGLVGTFCFAPVTLLQTYFIVRQIEKNEFVSSSMLPFWSVSIITFFISSAGQLTAFKQMFLNKRGSPILSPFIINFNTSIKEILISHCTFFIAHFLGIAARVGAISVYISFFINHLSIVTWKIYNNEEEFGIVTTHEDLSSFNSTDVDNRLISISKVHGLWLLCDLAFRVIFTILLLFFINKMGEGKTRARRWRKHLKLFSALVFVNLFTFFPSSNTHIHSNDKNRNSGIRDYCGTRFYLFFFIYYLVILIENVKCVGLWWAYLPANISMTPGVSYLMIPVIVFSFLSPILLFIHYWTLYSSNTERKNDEIDAQIYPRNPNQNPSNEIEIIPLVELDPSDLRVNQNDYEQGLEELSEDDIGAPIHPRNRDQLETSKETENISSSVKLISDSRTSETDHPHQ